MWKKYTAKCEYIERKNAYIYLYAYGRRRAQHTDTSSIQEKKVNNSYTLIWRGQRSGTVYLKWDLSLLLHFFFVK